MEYQTLITVLAEQTSYTPREIRYILRLLARIIGDELANGGDVQLSGLGRFRNLPRGAKSGRNRYTGERVQIPASRRIKFEPIRPLKERVKDSVKLFKRDNLELKYGLPASRKEKGDGEVRSGRRPRKSTKGKEGRSRG